MERLGQPEFNYTRIYCDPDPGKREDLNDGTGRASKKECVLPAVLKVSLVRINPHIPENIIDEIVQTLRRDYTGTDMVATNYELYNKIRNRLSNSLSQSLFLCTGQLDSR